MAWTAGRSSTRIGSMRSFSGGRATMPPPRAAPATPRGSVTYSGTSPARSSPPSAPQALGTHPDQGAAQAQSGALAARDGVVGRTALEVHRDQPLPGRQIRLGAAGQQPGRHPATDEHAVRRAGRQQQDRATGPRVGPGAARRLGAAGPSPALHRGGQHRLARRDPGDRQPEPMGQALGRRDPDPQPGEGARARSRRRSRSAATRRRFCSPRNRAIDGSSVSPWR